MDRGDSEIAAPCFSTAPLSNPDGGNNFRQTLYADNPHVVRVMVCSMQQPIRE
jgi:hypothetical protein